MNACSVLMKVAHNAEVKGRKSHGNVQNVMGIRSSILNILLLFIYLPGLLKGLRRSSMVKRTNRLNGKLEMLLLGYRAGK